MRELSRANESASGRTSNASHVIGWSRMQRNTSLRCNWGEHRWDAGNCCMRSPSIVARCIGGKSVLVTVHHARRPLRNNKRHTLSAPLAVASAAASSALPLPASHEPLLPLSAEMLVRSSRHDLSVFPAPFCDLETIEQDRRRTPHQRTKISKAEKSCHHVNSTSQLRVVMLGCEKEDRNTPLCVDGLTDHPHNVFQHLLGGFELVKYCRKVGGKQHWVPEGKRQCELHAEASQNTTNCSGF